MWVTNMSHFTLPTIVWQSLSIIHNVWKKWSIEPCQPIERRETFQATSLFLTLSATPCGWIALTFPLKIGNPGCWKEKCQFWSQASYWSVKHYSKVSKALAISIFRARLPPKYLVCKRLMMASEARKTLSLTFLPWI